MGAFYGSWDIAPKERKHAHALMALSDFGALPSRVAERDREKGSPEQVKR